MALVMTSNFGALQASVIAIEGLEERICSNNLSLHSLNQL
jgi:hypothetical protein